MRAVFSPQRDLLRVLERDWNLTGLAVEALPGGMNSRTWVVASSDSQRWAVKAVAPAGRSSFLLGLHCARCVAVTGIPAGAPVPAASGAWAVDLDDWTVAVLEWVEGEPLTPQDARLIGQTLASAHSALAEATVPSDARFDVPDPAAPHLDVEPWVRSAVTAAVDEYAAFRETLTIGLLHGDPEPEAFRRDRDRVGLIDWGAAAYGPRLYDLASAVMYVRGPALDLVAAYLETGPIPKDEVTTYLDPMVRLRWAVQADYFAQRPDHPMGLRDARDHLDR